MQRRTPQRNEALKALRFDKILPALCIGPKRGRSPLLNTRAVVSQRRPIEEEETKEKAKAEKKEGTFLVNTLRIVTYNL